MLLLFVPSKNSLASNSDEVSEHLHHKANNGLSLKSVYVISTLAMTIFFTSTVLLPIAMNEENFNESQIGQLLAFISLVAVVTAGFMPKITKKLGEPKVLAFAFLAFSLSYICFTQVSTLLLILGAILIGIGIGIGFGFSIPLLNHMTVELSDVKVRGRNLSYFTMAVFSGQFFTSFMQYIPGGEKNVFIICSVSAFIIALVLFFKPIKAK
ncbi:MFS transporter [Pseudoalteromonas arctica]|uniref:Major facilitator superfamily (MFS) profile domain-containing protein n=1 Tax=Pseudoalteromonas arctica A 37-1-2 TaxID=1117313 RepID=A0A290S2Z2_9GAMM|nr:MFS transporter [Pseudoalteromonas arctica]ATC86554.1 hypothetical protein PARC_a2016 [Pseudoalteromonas arctica A 37-1-2]